ncbi:unnamed protein product, partial [Tenebrio molitor]
LEKGPLYNHIRARETRKTAFRKQHLSVIFPLKQGGVILRKHIHYHIIRINMYNRITIIISVPNSHNITQTYNTKINKYLELSVAMRNLWCLEK